MSRINGIVKTCHSDSIERSFQTLCDTSWDGLTGYRNTWHNHQAGLGQFDLYSAQANEILNRNEHDKIVCCGKIVNCHDIGKGLPDISSGKGHRNQELYLLRSILKSKDYYALSKLNGLFSAALWQPAEERLVLVNDRYGFSPIYYSVDKENGKLVFSSDLRGVISAIPRKSLNWESVNNFLYFGHHLGDSTWFNEISVLPPASILVWERGHVSLKKYWDITQVRIDDTITHEQAVEGIIEGFRTSIKRRHERANQEEIVFLSGGVDSRRIAAELNCNHARFSTYTTRGFNTIIDNKSKAREVSKILGVKNTFVNLPQYDFLKHYWSKCNRFLDYETNLHQWMLPLVECIESGMGINYDGIGGDVLINGVLRTSGFLSSEGLKLYKSMDTDLLSKQLLGGERVYPFLAIEIRKKLSYDRAVEAVRVELKKYENTANQLTCFYLLNRTRRAIALSPLRLISKKIESFLPYMDNDFVEFALSIPLLIKVSHPLRSLTLDRAYPELSNIENTTYVKVSERRGKSADDIRYHQQRRAFLFGCVKKHFLDNNWIFSNRKALPRVFMDIGKRMIDKDHISSVFSTQLEVFYEFLSEYHLKDSVNQER